LAALKVSGTINVPGDKSISHRSLIFAALAEGESSIRGILRSADVESTASVLRSLGVNIPSLGDDIAVTGIGLRGMGSPRVDLDCGNSGTTARLMTGVVAGQPISARFTGDASLSRRPMKRVADPLTKMGANFAFEGADGLPMKLTGAQLSPIDWDTGVASAQVKSAILLAGLTARVSVTVREAAQSRDHTERFLIALGASVESSGAVTRLQPPSKLPRFEINVPGDPSSASFFIALAALAEDGELRLPGVCVNSTRGGFVRTLLRMGGSIELEDPDTEMGEDVATIRVTPAELHGIRIEGEDVPSMIDELPMLACLAAGTGVDLEIRGAGEMRLKESDRIRVVVENLRAIGADAEELPDGLIVNGERGRLKGRVVTHSDHRIAMAFGVLGMIPGNEILVDDPDCVQISYPNFWRDLKLAAA
jgi:3-phosphoshikimate 1-carboxyvinyltransferase